MLAVIAMTIVAVPSACVPTIAAAQTAGKTMTTPSGLQIIDGTVGTGASPKPGQICVMHYTGWLYEDGKKGKKFDSSVDRNEPFEFPIGQHRVIAGWDEGVASMKVGGKRTLIIPPDLGEPRGFDRAALRGLALAHPHALGDPRQMARFLCGLTSPATTRARLSRHALFGALAEHRFAQVMAWASGQ